MGRCCQVLAPLTFEACLIDPQSPLLTSSQHLHRPVRPAQAHAQAELTTYCKSS
ncbi:uncharacterized protein BJ212DRAFT_1330097 [Suillus subaureus]|uniref:Uncharacterized protein n=1 Tax=Suillus subaureus TaxID=48587 RepID=A0A9P7EI97_9AGAM|nr:uncharacterized protein BJ212DRAFT_1330097 [Suillus subaureus]KAG1822713.1 hypothetical protein BJ212DRAFT_1330097 [Suillus subaureus]